MPVPPVTVICLCYNQDRFVEEAIHSVLSQEYPVKIQLIVVDDASTDKSAAMIQSLVVRYQDIKFLSLKENVGNCRAFNLALPFAEGDFIIDLAADDILLPERVSKGVAALTVVGEDFDVNFTDADWVAENGSLLYRHSDRFPHKSIPQGNIYKDVVERFFICSPTVMFRKELIVSLGGYDESLSYEDFDFWIRSSRHRQYCYTPEVLVKKRVVRNSMSQKQFRILSPQLNSTYRVCEKIMALNRSEEEEKALAKRILYETKVALRLLYFPLVAKYIRLYFRNKRMRY